jgi:hypothetical protein
MASRNIFCGTCLDRQKKAVEATAEGMLPHEPSEHMRVVSGTAKARFRCDGCNAQIGVDREAHATTLYIDGMDPCEGWEAAYVAVEPEAPCAPT